MRKSLRKLPRNFALLCLAISFLAMNCAAIVPVQLSGSSGEAILTQVASVNATSQLTKASPADLWSWGKIPANYALNESGKLVELPSIDEDNTWIGPISSAMELETNEFT
jgi:hypothetical protein